MANNIVTQNLTLEPYAFFPCNADKDCLFVVPENIPITDALNQASCFLASAAGIVYANDCNEEGDYAKVYLIEMAKGIIDSAITNLVHRENKIRQLL